MNLMTRALALVCIAMCAATVSAQTATGTSGTTCVQNGTVLTCTTSTTVTLPSGVSLTPATGATQFGLVGSGPTGPACTAFTASPSTVTPGVATAILLSVACPAGSYTYSWASPVVATGASTTTALTLAANTSQAYSVTVCLASNANACNTYSTTVTTTGGTTPTLSSCAISPPSATVNQGATTQLTASCATGTGAGSGVTYQWTRNGSTIAGAQSQSYQLTSTDTASTGTFTYGVTINNNAPSQATPTASVTVNPVVVVNDGCPNVPVRATIEASSPYAHLYTSDFIGSFTAGDNFVVQLNVSGADSTAGRYLAQVTFADFGATRGGRYVTVSQNKCDYTANAKWVSAYNTATGVATPQNSAAKSVSLNEPSSGANIKLTPGTWYINVQNVVGSCPSNVSCHAIVEWYN